MGALSHCRPPNTPVFEDETDARQQLLDRGHLRARHDVRRANPPRGRFGFGLPGGVESGRGGMITAEAGRGHHLR